MAGCWDQAQIQLDVTRDDTMANLDVQVCDESGSPCDPPIDTPLFGNAEATLKKRVSIFTSKMIVLLRLDAASSTSGVCVNITTASHTLDRTATVHDTSVDWCTGCDQIVSCP